MNEAQINVMMEIERAPSATVAVSSAKIAIAIGVPSTDVQTVLQARLKYLRENSGQTKHALVKIPVPPLSSYLPIGNLPITVKSLHGTYIAIDSGGVTLGE